MKNLSKTELQTKSLNLEKENEALKQTVSKLLKEIDRLRGLEPKLIIDRVLSPEEEIIEIQISRLQNLSRERLLDSDETKQLDLLMKNKKILQENRKPEESDLLDVSPKELLSLAGGNDEKEKGS